MFDKFLSKFKTKRQQNTVPTVTYQNSVSAPQKMHTVTFEQNGLSAHTHWAINVAGSMQYSDNNTITLNMQEGDYDFVVIPVKGYKTDTVTDRIKVDDNKTIIINYRVII